MAKVVSIVLVQSPLKVQTADASCQYWLAFSQQQGFLLHPLQVLQAESNEL